MMVDTKKEVSTIFLWYNERKEGEGNGTTKRWNKQNT